MIARGNSQNRLTRIDVTGGHVKVLTTLICECINMELNIVYTVKQAAEKLCISTETIRYYTREGIITPRRDTTNGYRYYSERDIYLIRFVRQAKEFGLTIQEIHEILQRSHQGESPCPLVKEMVANRHHEIKAKIKELLELENKLALALKEWEFSENHVPTEDLICPLIEKGVGED